jgi:phosphotransferase system IIB component
MKKANTRHILIIVLSFLLLNSIHIILDFQDINMNYDPLNLNTQSPYLIMGLPIVFLGISIVLITKRIHDKYIKIHKDIRLTSFRWLLLLASLLVAYSLIVFEVNYYYTALTILLALLLYFALLKIYDTAYVKGAKRHHLNVNDELVTQLLNHLGGEGNIKQVSFEYSRLKVELQDVKIVNLEAIKDLGATGIFIAGNKLQAFVGNDAKELEMALKQYLS